MTNEKLYEAAKELYASLGVDTDAAMEKVAKTPVGIQCWQGDDVTGFENPDGELSGGIQSTGNYPGKARNIDELRADFETAAKMIPGTKKLSLHAIYLDAGGKKVARNEIGPEHFTSWVQWAKENHFGLDFNPTFFSHPKAADGLTLSNPDPKIRKFWIQHGIQCLKIGEYFAKELKSPCGINFWCPDGYKDEPSDRLGPRQRMADSLDKIFAYKYDKKAVIPFLESTLFGIGVESYTVNSHEFVMGYAMKAKILALLDMGHFHLTESVADKISSFLMTFGKVAFHISRPVRWDSDHVIRQNDDLRAAAQEIVKMDPKNFIIALDYFDASINRVAAWVLGMRNMQKELLKAMLTPWKDLTKLQNAGRFTEQLVLQEEYKNYPSEEIWAEFCARAGVVADEAWLASVGQYERDVLFKRG